MGKSLVYFSVVPVRAIILNCYLTPCMINCEVEEEPSLNEGKIGIFFFQEERYFFKKMLNWNNHSMAVTLKYGLIAFIYPIKSLESVTCHLILNSGSIQPRKDLKWVLYFVFFWSYK